MKPIEVFCKFDFEGNITLVRIKVMDSEGELQIYNIIKSKLTNIKFTNGNEMVQGNLERFMFYECEIEVDAMVKTIILRYTIPNHIWQSMS